MKASTGGMRPLLRAAATKLTRSHGGRGRSFATTSSRLASAAAATTQRERVRIVEVGPRDGLQNEKRSIPVETKLELVRRLAQTGLTTIEAGSFVSPKWVPQMANSSEILAELLGEQESLSAASIRYQWLLPNVKGLDNFLQVYQKSASAGSSGSTASPHEISIFLAATESFSRRNTNCSVQESLDRFAPLVASARSHGHTVRAYISVALGCPFEGPDVSPHRVAELAAALLEMGADEVSVADTTGMGTAPRTRELLTTLKAAGIRNEDLALHFHDTYGQALVNTLVGLEHGVTTYDSAVAGLGGCPYSPGATGNVATEDLVHTLHSLGVDTGVSLEKLSAIGGWISEELGRANGSRAGKALLARAAREASEGA